VGPRAGILSHDRRLWTCSNDRGCDRHYSFNAPGPSHRHAHMVRAGDLKFAMSASQGDFPRPILIPGDNEECFYMTMEAFNIAEKYQTPVIILSDKNLAESHKTTDKSKPEGFP